jgi:hypothetical protein
LLWENDAWLIRVASVAACAATPGTYFPNPVIGVSTTAYVHPFGSTNPTSDGKTYEAAIPSGGFEGYAIDGLVLEGFGSNRNLGHYGGITAGKNATIKKCLANRGGIHNIIAKSGLMEDVVAYDCDPAQTSPIPITFYATNPSADSWIARRCLVVTPNLSVTAIYSHGPPNPYASGNVEAFLSGGGVWNSSLVQINHDVCSSGTSSRILQIDSTTQSCVIRRAYGKIHNNNNAIYMVSGTGTVSVTHSCLYSNGTSSSSSILSLNSTGATEVKYNTIYAKLGSMFSPFPGTMTNNIFIWDQASNPFFTIPTACASDYNVYVRANASATLIWRVTSGGNIYTTLASWRAATGKDLNSVVLTAAQANDLFLNGLAGCANGDFRLNPACLLTFADGTPMVGNAGCQEVYDWNTRLVTAGQPARWPVAPATQAECQTYIQSPKNWNFYQ